MVSLVVSVVIPVVGALCLIRKFREWSWGSSNDDSLLDGRVFVVTGANSGIGKETVRELAKRKAKVILACRNIAAAEEAIADIRRTTEYGDLIPMHLDLASLDSIQEFAREVLNNFPQIHVLINNAGISLPRGEYQKTNDGFEVHFGINYLGHFFLTNLLLDRIKDSAPSRIVNVSSLLHKNGRINLDNLNGEGGEEESKARVSSAYCNSKLCNIYHTIELAQRLEGTDVDVNAVCPGWCYTGLMRHYSFRWYQFIAIAPIAFFFMRSARSGARNVVYLAADEKLTGTSGQFFRDCRPFKSPLKLDPALGGKLWDKSQQFITTKSFKNVQMQHDDVGKEERDIVSETEPLLKK